MTSLKERVAIVTRAGRGMGRTTAVNPAQCGAQVVPVDVEVPAESIVLAGPSAIAFAGSVPNTAAWAKLGETVDPKFGRTDIVVINVAFMRGLAKDLAGDGITCNAILPFLTNTSAKANPLVCQRQAVKRWAEPESIADPVAFLASEDAGFIAGQPRAADGGF